MLNVHLCISVNRLQPHHTASAGGGERVDSGSCEILLCHGMVQLLFMLGAWRPDPRCAKVDKCAQGACHEPACKQAHAMCSPVLFAEGIPACASTTDLGGQHAAPMVLGLSDS